MTKIKLCGLSRPCDIEAANELKPDYIGFVFAPKSKRYVTPETARGLKQMLSPGIQAVGVFVNETPEAVAKLLQDGVIDVAQLHGAEDEVYMTRLRRLTDRPIIKAFRMEPGIDLQAVAQSTADFVLLDSGAGTGTVFDWKRIQTVKRPYFLAGGLDADNASAAVRLLRPYAVDVSSGIETDGRKDKRKMAAFVAAVRKEEQT
ncbi:MAG: phosphoribosylanthranilate isomerase [Oscillospiraceae bacterium]|nr:phosphoribosylanthranilate isomerase [Oscillospiraceae bacterium]